MKSLKSMLLGLAFAIALGGSKNVSADESFATVAVFKVKPGFEAAFLREATKLVEPTRAEEGNSVYFMHQASEDPTEFLFYEQWKSQAALELHLQKPYIAEFLAATKSWFAEGYPQFKRYANSPTAD